MRVRQLANETAASLRAVLTRPAYILLALAVAAVFLAIVIWIPNYRLAWQLLASDTFSAADTLKIFFLSFGAIVTNFSPAATVTYIAVAVLAGLNVAQLTHYLVRRARVRRAAGASLFGVLASLFGIGCSACGSILVSTLFGLSTTAALTAALPLGGLEFGIFGAVLISAAVVYMAHRARAPLVCPPDTPRTN